MHTRRFTDRVLEAVDRALVGLRAPLRLLLTALACEGHVLLEDVPGTGKTAAVRAVGVATGLEFGRVQCTPDLLPSEITGVNVFRVDTQEFRFRPGPVFTSLLLVDEINRATPRSQSALLEAMAALEHAARMRSTLPERAVPNGDARAEPPATVSQLRDELAHLASRARHARDAPSAGDARRSQQLTDALRQQLQRR